MRSYAFIILGETKKQFLKKWSKIPNNKHDINDYFDIDEFKKWDEYSSLNMVEWDIANLLDIGEIWIISPITGRLLKNKKAKMFQDFLIKTKRFLLLDNFGKKEIDEYGNYEDWEEIYNNGFIRHIKENFNYITGTT